MKSSVIGSAAVDPHTAHAEPSRFPPGFLWGAGTSAYQVEGSPLADGAGPSNWHRFSHTPGMVHNGETGDVACDHYHRIEADVALMRSLGLTAYRFSVAWSRVLPAGRGRVNTAGLGFYERLVDTLLGSNIQPLVTLFHWDLPAALDDRGGWLNPDSPRWFADYADVVIRALDDRVHLWTTLNEPWVVADRGYLHGVLAPGHRSPFEAAIAAHHLLSAHAHGVTAYRASGRHEIGLVVNIEPQYPATDSEADHAAARRVDAYINRHYLDPVFLGTYPDELREMYGEAWPGFPVSEVEALRQPVDFVGVNYYTRSVTRADPRVYPTRAQPVPQPHATHTEMGWEVYPAGLADTLRLLRARYGEVPLYLTENGAAFDDPPAGPDGVIEDPLRVSYLRTHLGTARDALASGIDLRGYFAWSLLDNFEWNHGYSKRFGLVHVDYGTLQRTPKASARFYAHVIRTHGASLDIASADDDRVSP